jgi:hypothetical protein
MNDAALQAELERAEEAYENLIRTRATLGSSLAEAIRRGRDLSEFGEHMRDLPYLIRGRISEGASSGSRCWRGG